MERRMPANIAFEKYTLPNGLEVILHEDHTTPVVGVNLWYHVGSKNEKPGRTGFAHLFEHLMFQGSKHHDRRVLRPDREVGAQINGSTNTDRTNYYENVPRNALELALWLESDRMGFLLAALDQAKLDNQRDVVKNERRQRYDNLPYGQAGRRSREALFPPDHPYHWQTSSARMADLAAAASRTCRTFFRTYYGPITPASHRGRLRPRPRPSAWSRSTSATCRRLRGRPLERWVPHVDGEVRLDLEDRVQLPRLFFAWAARRASIPTKRRSTCSSRPRRRSQLPAVSLAGVREADRADVERLVQRDGYRRRDPHGCHRRTRPERGGGRKGAAGGDRADTEGAAQRAEESATGPQPPGSALRPSARERGRLWRPRQPPELLQCLRRRPRPC